jgi:hypothetical protein
MTLFGRKHHKPQIKVKHYKRRRQMRRDAEKMMRDGWTMQGQSGQGFSIAPLNTRHAVTVTWVKNA